MTSFQGASKSYDRFAQPQALAAQLLSSCLLDSGRQEVSVSAPDCLIDLGCGTGLATLSWLQRQRLLHKPPVGLTILVDLAPAMLETAVSLLRPKVQRLQGLLQDAFKPSLISALDAEAGQKGSRLILSSYLLQWSPSPLETLTEIWANCLRQGDCLAVALPDENSFAALHCALAEAALPFRGLSLPTTDDLLGDESMTKLQKYFQVLAAGSCPTVVAVDSAFDYLHHFSQIGATLESPVYSLGDSVRLFRSLDRVFKERLPELDYHTTWMILRRC